MKVLLSWINDFVDISSLGVEEIVHKLNQIGFEVEEVCDLGKNFKNVIVSKILSIEKHPNADKLVVCQVDIGEGRTLQIVTGATNMKVGDCVPLALDGAVLPCGKEIKNGSLRGVDSLGMFCGGEELGLDNSMYDNAEINGLLILTHNEKVGKNLADELGLNEIILDLNVLPNRPDCNSIIGIAREIACAFNLDFKMPALDYKCVPKKNKVKVKVQDDKLCPRYMGAYIENVNNAKSPAFMQRRLKLLGHNPHSLFVDITNYVLLEMGQPMHTFDADKIFNGIIVRRACAGEKLLALDGNSYDLTAENLVIADEDKPLVIAGIIGGSESGTFEDTKNIFLESAIFDYANIRHSKNSLGVLTDSCLRYSKGVYLNSADLGLRRALHLISELGVGQIYSDIVDVASQTQEERTVKARVSRINQILALNLSGEQMVDILNKLFIKSTLEKDVILCKLPDFRTDIERECDIIEEIGRIYGLQNIDENNLTKTSFSSSASITNEQRNINALKNATASEGYFEMISYQFVSPKLVCMFENREDADLSYIKVKNPIGKEFSVMRKLLTPAMLSAVSYNVKQSTNDIRLFELARVFVPENLPLSKLPKESSHLAMVLSAEGEDFYSIKNSLENIVSVLKIKLSFKTGSEEFLHPGRTADIYLYNRKIGFIGQVHPLTCEKFEIPKNTYVAEIDLTEILKRNIDAKKAIVPPKFANIEKDIALVCDKNLESALLIDTIIRNCKNEIENAFVFDVYEGTQVGLEKKSVAIKLLIKQNEKTLNESEIASIMNKAISVTEKLGAKLRN